MTTEPAKLSIWRRLAAVLEDMDGAIHPASQDHARIVSLEKRVERLEAFIPHDKPA